MTAKVIEGIIIFRTRAASRQLVEIEETFTSLDELFTRCLPLGAEKLVDRIIIRGIDENGNPRQLVLVFESVTVL